MASLNIQYLKGVGEKRAKLFKKLGVETVDALLHFYPREWRDYGNTVELYSAPAETPLSVKCRVVTGVDEQRIRGNMTIYRFGATDDSAYLQVTLFNNKFAAQKIKVGETYIFYGKLTKNGAVREMSSPEILPVDTGIVPIYPLTAGMFQSNVRSAMRGALSHIPDDTLPETLKKRYKLCDLSFALNNIHFPTDKKSLAVARYRLVFEELLMFRLGIALKRNVNTKTPSWALPECDFVEDFKKILPFSLTESQNTAINDCIRDMQSGKQMNRLVEGDVGSGKTAVAAALMYTVAKCGRQCAMMAPTEILAEQHFKTLSSFFADSGIGVELLIGAVKKSEKEKIKQRLKSGETKIVIGTQALLQSTTSFCSLSLVVTDEQHRFGVAQRARLAKKGEAPHLLVMSATPIPRTLALIMYGDLDISIMSALPRGRLPIKTYIAPQKKRDGIYGFIKKHLDVGQQAYIVCPLVEEGEMNIVPAKQYYEILRDGAFAYYCIGLLHGKQKPQEKEAVMRAFADGEIQLLVTTTVVEVGVDVPNATVMVIENAERFGLSQLHQLRGRVGRGSAQSSCILVSDAQNPETVERLSVLKNSTDGFKIASEDLRLRGPGDFLGNRQHGLPQFKIADISCNMDILSAAGEAAKELLKNDADLSQPQNSGLKNSVRQMFDEDIALN